MIYARIEWREMEGKSEETNNVMESVDKRMNPFRYEANVLLTGLRDGTRG